MGVYIARGSKRVKYSSLIELLKAIGTHPTPINRKKNSISKLSPQKMK